MRRRFSTGSPGGTYFGGIRTLNCTRYFFVAGSKLSDTTSYPLMRPFASRWTVLSRSSDMVSFRWSSTVPSLATDVAEVAFATRPRSVALIVAP